MKEVIGPILTFVLFVGGLLAWRLQLLDKRRFEVAEEILLAFDKLRSVIQSIRIASPQEGMYDYITKERGIDPKNRYAYYMAMIASDGGGDGILGRRLSIRRLA